MTSISHPRRTTKQGSKTVLPSHCVIVFKAKVKLTRPLMEGDNNSEAPNTVTLETQPLENQPNYPQHKHGAKTNTKKRQAIYNTPHHAAACDDVYLYKCTTGSNYMP